MLLKYLYIYFKVTDEVDEITELEFKKLEDKLDEKDKWDNSLSVIYLLNVV